MIKQTERKDKTMKHGDIQEAFKTLKKNKGIIGYYDGPATPPSSCLLKAWQELKRLEVVREGIGPYNKRLLKINPVCKRSRTIEGALKKISEQKQNQRKEELHQRTICLAVCLKEAPLNGRKHPLGMVFLLKGGMLENYHGSGEGTAYLNKKNRLIGWHYGYELPENGKALRGPDVKTVRGNLSCTEFCTF